MLGVEMCAICGDEMDEVEAVDGDSDVVEPANLTFNDLEQVCSGCLDVAYVPRKEPVCRL